MMRPTIVPIKKLISLKVKVMILATVCTLLFLFTVGSNLISLSTSGVSEAMKGSNFAFAFHSKDVADLSTLRLVQVIFRHGDRTPIERFPKDPYNSRKYWPEGWGRLTGIGKLMQYHLGQYIRNRYDGFLNKTYYPDEIYVQSSDKDRTIQSAMANLAGLYPPTQEDFQRYPEGQREQFVPIHVISAIIDNKIAFTKDCPRYWKEFSEVYNVPSEKAINVESEELYKFLSHHTGLAVTTYGNVSDIYDTLFVQKSHNLELPSWTQKVFPDKLRPLAERWAKANTFSNQMRKLRAGPILTDFVRNMKRTIGKPNEEEQKILEALFHTPAAKFYMYSGHDTTLSAILDALGLFDGKFPPYATSLFFELHQDPRESDNYFVKLFYRPDLQKPAYELELKNCGSKNEQRPCRFEDFMQSLQDYMIDEKQWGKECQV